MFVYLIFMLPIVQLLVFPCSLERFEGLEPCFFEDLFLESMFDKAVPMHSCSSASPLLSVTVKPDNLHKANT